MSAVDQPANGEMAALVERMAEAMYEVRNDAGTWGAQSGVLKNMYRSFAEVALDALGLEQVGRRWRYVDLLYDGALGELPWHFDKPGTPKPGVCDVTIEPVYRVSDPTQVGRGSDR